VLTVILTCWRRFDNLERIIRAWLSFPEVGEVILFDNSGGAVNAWVGVQGMLEDPRLWVIRSSRNYGSSARYAMAALATHEMLLFADDDYLPLPGLIADLTRHYIDNRMVGVKGRVFHGSWSNNTEVRGERMKPDAEPVEVDVVVGHCTLIDRKWLLGINYSLTCWTCCDLHVQGRIRQDVRDGVRPGPFVQIVVPTTKLKELPEASDEHSLYRQASAGAEKESVWDRYFKGKCLADGVVA